MKESEYKEICDLIEQVIYSGSKVEAKKYITRLEFLVSCAKSDLNGYAVGKLSRAVNSAKEAAGRAADKEHWASNVTRELYMLEKEIDFELDNID